MYMTLEECSLEEISPLLERFAKNVLSQNKPTETVQNDLFYALIVILMLENGFLPKIKDSVIQDDVHLYDLRQFTVEKLTGGIYETEFVMSGFHDLPLKIIISPLGALMIVNLIFNNNNSETYSVCLPISRYVVSPQASTIPLIFRDLKHLSITFKDKILCAAKSKVLSFYGYASASLVGLPDDVLVYNVLFYLPVESVIFVSRTCKKLKAISDNESLWRELYKRDFKNLVSPKLSGWKVLYKEAYLAQKETHLREVTSIRNVSNHPSNSFSFLSNNFSGAYFNLPW